MNTWMRCAAVGLMVTGAAIGSARGAAEGSVAPVSPAFKAYLDGQPGGQRRTAAGHALGHVPAPLDLSYNRGVAHPRKRMGAETNSSYDLRILGRVTDIRNQSPYGTCWTFASMASLESCLLLGETWNFSENNLANLHGFVDFYNRKFDRGGNATMAAAYMARYSGPASETDDPYPSVDTSTNGTPIQKHLQSMVIIPDRTNDTDNALIKQAIVNYGALYTSFYVDDRAPYYNTNTYAYYFNGTSNGNHAVAIVGWDDNFSGANFLTTPDREGAFIVKNSWGTNWGENGYFYVSYYDKIFARDGMNAAFCGAQSINNYGAIYQYDPLGWVTSIGWGDTTAWGANIFVAPTNDTISAVSFYAVSDAESYEIRVYRNGNATNPVSGDLMNTQTGAVTYAGYYTVPLATNMTVTAGQRFSVAVKFTVSAGTWPVPISCQYPRYSEPTNAVGKSFVSPAATTWYDMTNSSYLGVTNGSVCIKAFGVAPEPPPEAPVVDLFTPTNGATYSAPADIAFTIHAYCTNLGATVTQVVLKVNDASVWSGTNSPFGGSITGVTAGVYTLKALAWSGTGESSTSTPATITVTGTNLMLATFIMPTNGTIFADPANIYVSAHAYAFGGATITQATVYANGTEVLSGTNAFLDDTWSNVTAGAYALTFKAWANHGDSVTTDVVNITVTNYGMAAYIVQPSTGTIYYGAPADIYIDAHAYDFTPGSAITQSLLYANGSLIHSGTNDFTFYTWSNVAVGVYSLTYQAWSCFGHSVTSDPVVVSVVEGGTPTPTPSVTETPTPTATATLTPTPVPSATPVAPTGVAASDRVYTDKVRVSWNVMSDATFYRVYRGVSQISEYASELGIVTHGTSYDDSTAVPGTVYYYFVRSYNGMGAGPYSTGVIGERRRDADPQPTPGGHTFANVAVYQQSQGLWYILNSSNIFHPTSIP